MLFQKSWKFSRISGPEKKKNSICRPAARFAGDLSKKRLSKVQPNLPRFDLSLSRPPVEKFLKVEPLAQPIIAKIKNALRLKKKISFILSRERALILRAW